MVAYTATMVKELFANPGTVAAIADTEGEDNVTLAPADVDEPNVTSSDLVAG